MGTVRCYGVVTCMILEPADAVQLEGLDLYLASTITAFCYCINWCCTWERSLPDPVVPILTIVTLVVVSIDDPVPFHSTNRSLLTSGNAREYYQLPPVPSPL